MTQEDDESSGECGFPGCSAEPGFSVFSVDGSQGPFRYCGRHAEAFMASILWEVEEL